MSGKPSSPNSSGINFLETGHEDRYMKEVFENVNQVPEKENLNEKSGLKKSRENRKSPFARLSGADEQIDLHGKTREEAIIMVQNFIKTSHAQGLCHILIITGKGKHSGDQGPVLKITVEQWLKKNGHTYLKEFYNAPSHLGGTGAIWVELK